MSSVNQGAGSISCLSSGDSDRQEFLSFIQEMLTQTGSISELESTTAVPNLTFLLTLPKTEVYQEPADSALGDTRPERLYPYEASPTTQASEGDVDPNNRSAYRKPELLPEVHARRQSLQLQLPSISDT